MLLIRRFEERSAEMYALGKIGGFCHLYIGQEAVAVGALSCIVPGDKIVNVNDRWGQPLSNKTYVVKPLVAPVASNTVDYTLFEAEWAAPSPD